MRPSQPLYDALAPDYDAHFAVPHRRAYDDLAWERVRVLLPPDGPVVDAGCGVGRWARRLLDLGHPVTGVEQAPGMVAELRRRPPGPGFTLVEGSMTEVTLPATAGAVLAMGSLQYTAEPEDAVRHLAGWLRPGGVLAVLVDSLVGLVLELVGAGRGDEAVDRLARRRGVWRAEGQAADLHLLDRARLEAAFDAAGLVEVRSAGLLVSAGPLGRAGLAERLAADRDALLALERRLGDDPLLADAGKQLLVTGRRAPV
ncbi:class I SAM-dependent methyltransferase [Micromonospora sp. NPDC050980]|uniref:class I SAM-dependent methyltransferase n=1 Tax=Micromonospora sp. NPDC050980 TaxID=3155161 RepID=UPI0033FB7472